MNTNAIRDLSVGARHKLMEGVERRCLLYDIREGASTDVDAVDGRVLSATERKQRAELVRLLQDLRHGKKPGESMAQLVERATYTWFNRLFAIRFMEANDRLPSHVRILSAQDGGFEPECLREAFDLPLQSLDTARVAELVAAGDDEGLFRAILLAQCDELAGCMPAVFERVGAAMGLLLPDNLLATGGVVEALVTAIPEDDWREGVEVVGWAYQFYVSERKDEFFKSKRKAGADDIAPATQLFTPEYIVRFLVQNSLGRLWVLNNPDSPLADAMEYFVKPDPDSHEDFRKIGSPEEITLVDPACGSGHFLCYAFGLLAAMYEERGYRRRDVPRLILTQNLTGIEIDQRAASLTAFALTMKACELDGRFLRRAVAPRVTCLESIELTPEELVMLPNTLELAPLTDVLAHLGEVGSLWCPTHDEAGALDQLAREAAEASGLFAGTAVGKLQKAKEFARVLGTAYDICATNPPYMGTGNLAPWMSRWVKKNYPTGKSDLCTCFVRRGLSLTKKRSYNAQVTMQSWMFLSSYEALRHEIIEHNSIIAMAHLGARAFDAIAGEVVQTVATVFLNGEPQNNGFFIRLVNNQNSRQKDQTLKSALQSGNHSAVFVGNADTFTALPGWPIAYWISKAVVSAFRNPPLEQYADARRTLQTGNANRFMREWFEVSLGQSYYNHELRESAIQSMKKWFPMNYGGEYRKWYGNLFLTVNWENNGKEIKDTGKAIIPSESSYFEQCLAWSKISSGSIAFRFYDAGLIPGDASACLFNISVDQYALLGYLNSSVAQSFLNVLNPTLNYPTGTVGQLPLLLPNQSEIRECDSLVMRCIAISRADWDAFETSWDFSWHPLLSTLPPDEGPEVFSPSELSSEARSSERLRIPLAPPAGTRVADEYARWEAECDERFATLKANEEELNRIFARIYHMEGEVPIEVPDDKVSVRRADFGRDIRSLISYAVGCMFGRYSLDKPGLVLANQGDGIKEYLVKVPDPTFMPDEDGILPVTDDEYFKDDIVAMFVAWMRAAYGEETLEENLRFVADALGGKGSPRKVIRDYFMNGFFKDHCATYSVASAGKRPIYWLVDSGRRGGFRALIYMHRYQPDLLARVRTDYVHERQERYRSRIAELEDQRGGATRREQAAIDRELRNLRAQLEEVTAFEERLHHLADQMIRIDLDDGFKVNYAKFADVMAKVR